MGLIYKDVNVSNHTEILDQISKCKKQIEIADALERLSHNRDFIRLRDALLKDESHCLVMKLSQLGLDSQEHAQVVRSMDAISYFNGFLIKVAEDGVTAYADIREARRFIGDNIEE